VVATELRSLFVGLAVVVVAAFATACDEDTRDEADEAVERATEDVDEGVDDASARAGAEAFRASLKAQETDDDAGGVRQIDALEEAADDVPGSPDIAGIADDDGDGVDDDGRVEVRVGDQVACVELPESGDEIDVTDDACI
jgi:hypothetical protein